MTDHLDAGPDLIDFCRSLGRTEDVAFSPGGRRLALTAFRRESIAIVDLEGDSGVPLRMCHAVELTTPSLRCPHGVDFLDDDTLVVANRHGGIELLHVGTDADGAPSKLTRLEAGDSFAEVASPGSVRVGTRREGGGELFVCDNRLDRLTAHHVSVVDGRVTASTDVLEDQLLDLPDGVATTDSVLAVSNHDHHVVLLYERADPGSARRAPCAFLRGSRYPHGLAFTPDGTHLFVADAGTPNVCVYERGASGWQGVLYPTRLLPVTTDEEWASIPGADEGGPKGMSIDPAGMRAAVTSETVPLEVIEIARVTSGELGRAFDAETKAAYEAFVMESVAARRRTLQRAVTAARNRPLSKLSRLPAWIRYQRKLRAAERQRARRADGRI